MEDQRKYAILVSASIFSARKLADWDGAAHTPRTISAFDEAIRKAEKLIKEIERRSEYRTPSTSSHANASNQG